MKKFRSDNLSIGITLFIFGLFKKVVLADNIAIHANLVFNAAENGVVIGFFDAWAGALAYTFQLYFDFSGYSDMAIGIARMFGITLPVNFYSPYKACNIIEFWKRWHITLSRFLRDYLYIPLGGNRKGERRKYINIMITMLLGGVWHGAGWTFAIWGMMHGLFLIVNHAWRKNYKQYFLRSPKINKSMPFTKFSGWLVTFVSVVCGWVVFRANTFAGAKNIYAGMLGLRGISLPPWLEIKSAPVLNKYMQIIGVNFNGMFNDNIISEPNLLIRQSLIMALIILLSPNTLDLLQNDQPALGMNVMGKKNRQVIIWKYNIIYSMGLALLTTTCILSMARPSDFLYFQF